MFFRNSVKQAKDGIFAANITASLALLIAITALYIAFTLADDGNA